MHFKMSAPRYRDIFQEKDAKDDLEQKRLLANVDLWIN